MNSLTMEAIEEAFKELPAFSACVTEVLSLIEQGEADGEEIAAVLEKDQALSLRVLRVANSPFYGMSGSVQSLQEACVILGLKILRNLVIAAGVMDRFPASPAGGIDAEGLWRHAVGVAVGSELIARHLRLDADLAYLGGMFHDVGKLVLATQFGAQYQQVMVYQREHDCLLQEAELAVLKIGHAQVGASLMAFWNLPKALGQCVGGHHQPDDYADQPLVSIVHVADILARSLDLGNAGDDLMPALSRECFARLKLDWELLQTLLPNIEQKAIASFAILN